MSKHIDKKWLPKVTCLHCPLNFKNISGRSYHHKKIHPDKSINECFCGQKLRSRRELKDHLLMDHSKSNDIGEKMMILTNTKN